MKRFVCLFLLVITSLLSYAFDYEIVKMNMQSLKVGNKTCTIGSKFNKTDIIHWNSSSDGMKVKDLNANGYRYFKASSFMSSNSKTANDYNLFKINHPSTMGDDIFDIILHKNNNLINENRIALLIGNSNYSAETSLSSPIPDVEALSLKLSTVGFNVYVVYDANKPTLNAAFKKFFEYAKQYETALVYYAGHGLQYENDTYLMPIESVTETMYDIEEKNVPLGRIVGFLNKIDNLNTRILIIDACRSNRQLLSTRGVIENELHSTKELTNGMILFSTQAGNIAYDYTTEELHSPFAKSLIKNITLPNLSINDLPSIVISDVQYETESLNIQQRPRYQSTLDHIFYFNPTVAKKEIEYGSHLGHEYVDLNLPSGTLWATCNIGANSPEENGEYFAWGETIGNKHGKKHFGYTNYKFSLSSDGQKLSKYILKDENGSVDNRRELEKEDDAAYQLWGNGWQMPSIDQINELASNTKRTLCIQNGVRGVKFTSLKNGLSIFLPASGIMKQVLIEEGVSGYYSSKTLYVPNSQESWGLFFNASKVDLGRGDRCCGLPIRPVMQKIEK